MRQVIRAVKDISFVNPWLPFSEQDSDKSSRPAKREAPNPRGEVTLWP
jgi:hypothetical protein